MITRLFRFVLTIVILAVIGGAIYLYLQGYADPYYYNYELEKVTPVGYEKALSMVDKEVTPAAAAEDPDRVQNRYVRWRGIIRSVRAYSGSVFAVLATDRDGVPWAAVSNQEAGDLVVGKPVQAVGLLKPLLIPVRDADGKTLPTVLAVDVRRPPSKIEQLEKLGKTAKDALEELLGE
jgi:hypothetical protein